MVELTCVIPAYNEKGVGDVVSGLKKALKGKVDYEVIVVDDGSDKPVELGGVTVLRHHVNMGYGAALKTGIMKAQGARILIVDADGTYPLEIIPDLLDDDFDMVVGARTGENVHIPLYRIPAKWFLRQLANYLSGTKIPDLNSGLRVFNRERALEFLHLYPRGFSFTTTITLAFLCNDYTVKYTPIEYHVREGKSKIKPIQDGVNFIGLIVRTILYFNPLKIFVPASAAMMLLAILIFMYTSLALGRVMDITVITISVTSIEIMLFGLLADLIVKRVR